MDKTVSHYFSIPENIETHIVDLRDFEAPEPMEKILLACAQLKPDDYYLAHLPHVPMPLFPFLEKRGLNWRVHEQADGSAVILIRKTV